MQDRFAAADGTNLQMLVAPYLRAGERVLWIGRPQGSLFTKYDFYLIPFSLVWLGLVSTEAMRLVLQNQQYVALAPFSFFFLIGLYLLFGRFIAKAFARKRTVYAVTDRQVIEKLGARNRSLGLAEIPGMTVSGGSGRGSVVFEAFRDLRGAMFANSGLEWLSNRSTRGAAFRPIGFYDIQDPEGVARQITDAARAIGATVTPSQSYWFSAARVTTTGFGEGGHLSKGQGALRLLAALGLTFAVGLNIISWLPVDLSAVPDIWLFAWPVMLGVFIGTFFQYRPLRVGQRLNPMRNILPFIPRWLRFVFVAVFFYVAINFLVTSLSGTLPGQPEQSGNRYYFDNHGVHVPTTRAGYVRGLSLVTRMFSGGEVIFFGLPFIALTYAPPVNREEEPDAE